MRASCVLRWASSLDELLPALDELDELRDWEDCCLGVWGSNGGGAGKSVREGDRGWVVANAEEVDGGARWKDERGKGGGGDQ